MKKNIDLINKVFLGICLTNWILFFTFIWDVNNYWLGALWFLLSIGLTFPYVATTKKAIKVMTEDEPEQFIEYIDELTDWQECYKIAEDKELERKVNEIIENVRKRRENDAPRI
ncbi:hypothetical protein [Eubacterium sp.]